MLPCFILGGLRTKSPTENDIAAQLDQQNQHPMPRRACYSMHLYGTKGQKGGRVEGGRGVRHTYMRRNQRRTDAQKQKTHVILFRMANGIDAEAAATPHTAIPTAIFLCRTVLKRVFISSKPFRCTWHTIQHDRTMGMIVIPIDDYY